MMIHFWRWDLFIAYKVTDSNVGDLKGVYLFDWAWQPYYKGFVYLFGLRRNYA